MVVSPGVCQTSLHDVVTLKSVDLLGCYPKGELTLPPGCLLRVAVALKTCAQWEQWQAKDCTTSMLQLRCMQLHAWPVDVQEMSGLRYLSLHIERVQDQDLAVLQHIPHVRLVFGKFSTFLLTSESWQSLQVWGMLGSMSAFQVQTRLSETQSSSFFPAQARKQEKCTHPCVQHA